MQNEKVGSSLTHNKKKMAAVCSATCNPDGKWSSPNPQCLAPCIIPEVEHGRPSERVGDKVRKPNLPQYRHLPELNIMHALKKKKIKFSSYIRKFRMEQLQSHIQHD
jgi:hypothetical protein